MVRSEETEKKRMDVSGGGGGSEGRQGEANIARAEH